MLTIYYLCFKLSLSVPAIENFEYDDERCLSLTVGDTVHVLKVFGKDWAYGYITYNQDMKGIFPRAYIQVVIDCLYIIL